MNQDATGGVEEVTVSNWLKNVTGTGDVEDVSNLKDIKNVKGEETFKQGSDGKLTWKAGSAGEREFYVDVKDKNGNTVRSSVMNVNTTK